MKAYRLGEAGEIFHINCWWKMAEDYFHRTGRRAYIGTLYYYQHDPALKGRICPECKLPFDQH